MRFFAPLRMTVLKGYIIKCTKVLWSDLAIIVGKVLGKQLPEKSIKYGAATIFLVTGVVTLAETVFSL
jgi:putative Ca2+/H+ antiporter (TMEM165/GDT1 family)